MDAYATSRTRDNITYIIVPTVIGTIIAAGIYGVWQQNFGALTAVWTVTGPIAGAILGHYFHRGRKD
jgi:hypothetical protein